MTKQIIDKMSRLNPNVVFAIFPVCILLTGCSPAFIDHTALERARADYELAENNPSVEKNAPVALYEAKRALERAERATMQNELDKEAYLAERKVQIALALSEEKEAEKQLEELTKENEKILLERSRRESAKMAKQVELARQQAEQLKKDAEAKASEAEQARLDAENAKEALNKMQEMLAELKAKQTDKGIILTLKDVLFETGKAELLPGAMRTIEKVSDFLLNNPQRNVLIEGHTDDRGGDELNQRLSEQRAYSVRMALIDYEVPPQRIAFKGYGKRFPVASNKKESGRQQNRRVEIIILNEGVSAESLFR